MEYDMVGENTNAIQPPKRAIEASIVTAPLAHRKSLIALAFVA
jgi:hypothetical protein